MNKINLRRFVKDTRGAGLTEYIILVGVIAILALAGFKAFGGAVKSKVEAQKSTIDSEVNGSAQLASAGSPSPGQSGLQGRLKYWHNG